ncbi:hypothetical protein Tco_0232011 [Tanacetum coccineum]
MSPGKVAWDLIGTEKQIWVSVVINFGKSPSNFSHPIENTSDFSDLALLTSLNDLKIAALHIDVQSIDVDIPLDIIDVDEYDDIIDAEDLIHHDLADSDDKDLVSLDIDDDMLHVVTAVTVAVMIVPLHTKYPPVARVAWVTKLESQPEYGGGSWSGGCRDVEPGDDEDDDEDEEDDGILHENLLPKEQCRALLFMDFDFYWIMKEKAVQLLNINRFSYMRIAVRSFDKLSKADDDTKKKSRPFLSQIFFPVFLKQTQREVEGASIQDNDSAPYYDFDHGSNADVKLQPTNNITRKRGSKVDRKQNNSEEEQYMWDGLNS